MVQRYNPDYIMHAARFEPFARESEHGEYVRFDAHQQVVSALEAERDALEIRLRNALTSEQEAIQRAHAANQTADDLAVENAALNKSLDDVCESYENGQSDLLSEAIDKAINLPSPATDAALAAIHAQGVEKFADMCREKSKLATTADSCAGWSNCSVHASSFAIRLREAK